MLRNELISGFGGQPASGQYQLALVVRERRLIVSSLSATRVRRFRSQWTVKYSLSGATGGKVLSSGESVASVQYDVMDEPIADMQALENAHVRVAREVAQDIRIRLSAYFASQGG